MELKLKNFRINLPKNNKWDYIVILGLVGLQLLVFNYGLMNTIVYSEELIEGFPSPTIEMQNNLTDDYLIYQSVYLFLIIVSIIFFPEKSKNIFISANFSINPSSYKHPEFFILIS